MKLMKQYIILFIAFLSLTSFQGKDSGNKKTLMSVFMEERHRELLLPIRPK